MLLSFSANSVAPEILEKTLIGRRKIVDQVEQELLEKIIPQQTYQSLLIAPRGSGKTHITKVLHHRLKNNKQLDDKMLIAYMNEDERGIANFSDFIRHVLLSFIKHQEGNYTLLSNLIYEVADLPPKKQETAFIDILLDYVSDKGVVLLIENLNILFDKKTGMGPDGQNKLRSLMHEHNQFSIMATSQSLFYHIQDAKGAFYNFFNIRHLKKLDFEQALRFIKTQASLENSELLEQEIEKPIFKGKVRAIYQLTGGNHRLLVIFFNFLKTNIKSDLSKVFVKTMNDLKPYYEQFLNALSPQQQKVIQFLSSSHTPQMGKTIARYCFIASNTLSKQTSELVDKGHLDKNKVGKDTYYELKEPLMRICFEITNNADGVAKLFIDFLAVLYSESDLQKRYLKFKYGVQLQDKINVPLYNSEALMYKNTLPNEIIERLDSIPIPKVKDEEELEKEINYILQKAVQENLPSTENVYSESLLNFFGKDLLDRIIQDENFSSVDDLDFFEKLIYEKEFSKNYFLYKHLSRIQFAAKKIKKAIVYLEKSIKINAVNIEDYIILGDHYFYRLKDYKKALIYYKKTLKTKPNKIAILLNIVKSLIRLKKYKQADEYINKILVVDSNNAEAFNLKGENYRKQEKNDKAIKSYYRAIKIDPNNEFFYTNIGHAYYDLNRYEEAIKNYKQAVKINPKNPYSYVFLGLVEEKIEKYKNAISAYEKAVQLNPEQASFYSYLGSVHKNSKDNRQALEYYKKAIELDPEQISYHLEIAAIYSLLGEYDLSINSYDDVIKLNPIDAGAYLFKGAIYYHLKNYKQAIASYLEAIERSPNEPVFYGMLSIIYMENQEMDKAIMSLEKGMALNEENSFLYACLSNYYLVNNNLEEIKNNFHEFYRLFHEEENSFLVFLNAGTLNPLLKYTNLDVMKEYLPYLVKELEEKKLLNELWKAFSDAIFNVLINIEEYTEERLDQINDYLQEQFKGFPEMTIPLLYLRIGIRFLKKGDKRALYDLSKEERQIFKEFVLDKRNVVID